MHVHSYFVNNDNSRSLFVFVNKALSFVDYRKEIPITIQSSYFTKYEDVLTMYTCA